MAPYLQTVKSFADVPVTDEGVDTAAFLEASRGLVGIFDLIGSSALNLVSNDLNGNITKVQTRYDAATDKSKTLELLVKNEMAEKKSTATQGLLWLLRGQSFTCKALQATQADKQKGLSDAFNESYEKTLKPHHSFLIRPVFAVAMKACPQRDGLYTKLKEDKSGGVAASQDVLDTELDKWLASLEQIVQRVDAFYEKNGYKKGL
ncbi:het-c2 protein [Rickenella mellea]|uniref:Het-c2 protein n=1 Tax=Rickenella mellea TaxID=50990 RepID=A0A4Y7QEH6_9AGAM|nr:het-c2 protein [Rickenella mellea]